jgi:hypothetical protein
VGLNDLATHGLVTTMVPGALHGVREKHDEAYSFGTFGAGAARHRDPSSSVLPTRHGLQLLHDRERQAVLRLSLISEVLMSETPPAKPYVPAPTGDPGLRIAHALEFIAAQLAQINAKMDRKS